jgi:hypothetical protein
LDSDAESLLFEVVEVVSSASTSETSEVWDSSVEEPHVPMS